MTLFVVTIGFEEKFAVRMITRHGLDRGDRILLATGPPAPQSDRVIGFLTDFVTRYYGSDVGVKVLHLNPAEGFESMVQSIVQAVRAAAGEGERVVFNLSGGMRSICIAALLAAQLLASSGASVEAELETEDSSTLLSVPTPLLQLPRVARELTPEKIEILQALSKREATVKKLSQQLGRDESTLARHIRALASLNLLQPQTPRPTAYKATQLALLIAETLNPKNRGKQRKDNGKV
ncbi:MAG: CRISPR-associated CARF protein Csa3 [Thermofilaceae archaeon]